MNIHEVHRGITKHRKTRRISRGVGSGHGKTGGRGGKGQKARAGWWYNVGFEGGQMPLIRRVPKRGFTNSFAVRVGAVNVGALNDWFQAGEEVTVASLQARGLIKRSHEEVKILGDGELSKKLKVSAHRFSQSAKEKIEKAGGEAVVVPGKACVEEKKRATRAAKKAAK